MGNLRNIVKNNKVIINNMLGALCVKGGSVIISLLIMPAYLHYFKDQKILGIWFTILSVLNWVLMFDLGLGNGLRNKLTYAITKGEHEACRKYISSTYISTTVLIIVLSLISIFIIPSLNWNKILNISESLVTNKVIIVSVKIVFMGIMIQFLLKLITSILYSIQKSAIVNFITLSSNIIILILIKISPSTSLEANLIRMAWINIFAINFPLLVATIIVFSTILKDMRPRIKYFDIIDAKQILQIGGTLLWLQVIFMIISSTNEFLISFLTKPEYVVEYQAYNKIFNSASSIFVLALTPIWSAVTKAQSEKNYNWISKLYRVLLMVSTIIIAGEFFIIPFLQLIINIWLGESGICAINSYAIIFIISNGLFIIHNVNTSICNGLSYFKIQVIWMTVAAIVDVPLAYIFVNITGSWIGVVLANIVALLPYEILQPLYFKKISRKKFEGIDNRREEKK